MKPAKTLFAAGSALMILMGAGHFYGQFGPKEFNIQRSLIEEAMKQYKLHGLGFEYSLFEVMQCWGVFFGVLMILLGAQNMLILRTDDQTRIRTFSVFNMIGAVLLAVVGAVYVPFTSVGLAVIALCYAVSALLIFRN